MTEVLMELRALAVAADDAATKAETFAAEKTASAVLDRAYADGIAHVTYVNSDSDPEDFGDGYRDFFEILGRHGANFANAYAQGVTVAMEKAITVDSNFVSSYAQGIAEAQEVFTTLASSIRK